MNPDHSWSGFFVFEKSIQTVDGENFIVLIGNTILAVETHFMKKYKSLLFTGLLPFYLFFFCACDQSTRHRKLIINNSDHDLILLMPDSVFVGKHNEVTIYDYTEFRRVKSFKSCDSYNLIQGVIVADSLNLTIDLNDESNWMFHVIRRELSGYGECECRLDITNQHFQ